LLINQQGLQSVLQHPQLANERCLPAERILSFAALFATNSRLTLDGPAPTPNTTVLTVNQAAAGTLSHINARSTTLTWSIRYAAKPSQNTALMSRNLLRNSKSDAGIGEQFIMSPPTQYLLIQIYDAA